MMQATPATWRMLLDAGWTGSPNLQILCGGETLPRNLAERLLTKGARLWNLYGPTETTIWSALHLVESGDGPVPLGRPIAQTQHHVFDRHLQPLPIGIPGELYIGGAGLARGYLNQSDLTAQRFIPDPSSSLPNARLYRTGDTVRRMTDGNLEFLGRFDQQVKLRGYRIELGEIETALATHPDVREARAIVREDTPGDQRLIAYFIPNSPAHPTTAQLRAFLQSRLPEYMLPAATVVLDRWPLTPNGKLDIAALPQPQRPQSAPTPRSAPQTKLEQDIAAIWQETLRVERVGLDENFFDLGGHSLLLAQMHSRLRDRLHLDLSMLDLFRHPTVASLATSIAQGADNADEAFRQDIQARVQKRRAALNRTRNAP
jgi:acyl-CoA synthetase (AMP-forming)/AMP-acid ligase II/acyl carrier protein